MLLFPIWHSDFLSLFCSDGPSCFVDMREKHFAVFNEHSRTEWKCKKHSVNIIFMFETF